MSELGKVIEELERFERDTRDFRGQPMSLLMPDQVEALTEYGKATFAHAPTLIAAAKRAEQAEAEVGRLRKALEKIEAMDRYTRECSLEASLGDPRSVGVAMGHIEAAIIARKALTPPPTANAGATT